MLEFILKSIRDEIPLFIHSAETQFAESPLAIALDNCRYLDVFAEEKSIIILSGNLPLRLTSRWNIPRTENAVSNVKADI